MLEIVGFVAGLLVVIGVIIGGTFWLLRRRFGPRPRTDGIPGLARVIAVKPTGAQINGAYVYDVDLVVDQTRVPAYRTTARVRVHRDDGLLRGGEILSVTRLREDGPEVSVLAGPARSPQDALVPQDAPPWA